MECIIASEEGWSLRTIDKNNPKELPQEKGIRIFEIKQEYRVVAKLVPINKPVRKTRAKAGQK